MFLASVYCQYAIAKIPIRTSKKIKLAKKLPDELFFKYASDLVDLISDIIYKNLYIKTVNIIYWYINIYVHYILV